MKLGFSFFENMYGSYREIRPDGRSGRFDFSCSAVVDDVTRFLSDRTGRITGQVTMDGAADRVPMEGTIRIDPLIDKEIAYDFTFRAGESRYRFLGKKSISFLDPVESMTTLIGKVEKDGITLADVESHFSLLELPAFLLSYRPVIG